MRAKPWKQRAIRLSIYFGVLAVVAILVMSTFEENIIFYYSPKDISLNLHKISNKTIRIGGLVKENSIQRLSDDGLMNFVVTDHQKDLKVHYRGITPALFKEGQGTVVLGKLNSDGSFNAFEVLAKHDENYIPKEVIQSLKESSNWKKD